MDDESWRMQKFSSKKLQYLITDNESWLKYNLSSKKLQIFVFFFILYAMNAFILACGYWFRDCELLEYMMVGLSHIEGPWAWYKLVSYSTCLFYHEWKILPLFCYAYLLGI